MRRVAEGQVVRTLHNLSGQGWRGSGRGANFRGGRLARPLQFSNVMNATDDLAMDGNDDDLFGGWFEESELTAAPEAAPYEEMRDRGSRVGVVVAAISATVLTLVLVFAGRV